MLYHNSICYYLNNRITGWGIFSAAAPTCIALYGAYFSKPNRPSPAVKVKYFF